MVTGGPGGGKTTAVDLFRRELGDQIVVVPEAATMLFSGGFPRSTEPLARRAAQRAIYHVQRNLEDVQRALYPDRVLLCDRGTLDGAAYWPDDEVVGYWEAMGTTEAVELERYDAVIFFETAARGGLSIEGGNPTRTESNARALELDARLAKLWSRHPRFVHVPHDPSFVKKIVRGLGELDTMVRSLR